eukprot:COSAG05_NODE_6435_length_958_cov_4.103609_1_plen_159_part_00
MEELPLTTLTTLTLSRTVICDTYNSADFMQKYCNESNQRVPMLQGLVDTTPVNISVAAFLITRGRIAFIGSGVFSPPVEPHATDDIFRQLDVGTPTGLCKEGPPGRFSRAWSKGSASLDCNAWTSTLNFPTASDSDSSQTSVTGRTLRLADPSSNLIG